MPDPTLTPVDTTFDDIAGSLRRLVHLAEARSGESSALINKIALAQMLSLSPRKIDGMVSAGRCPKPIAIGKLRRWKRVEINLWVDAGCPPVSVWQERKSTKENIAKFAAFARPG